ncbi:MAG: ATP synthase F0 subunit B [Acidobacteriaceae bacterium]
MKYLSGKLVVHRKYSSWLSMFEVAFCGLLLLSLAAPCARAIVTDSAVQTVALAQNSESITQTKQHAERQEEIKQSKIDNPEAEDGENVYRHSAMVHTLARTFGLSVETTSRIFETINFLILLAVILWFLARSLPRTLRSRTERIQNQLQQARTASEEAKRRMAAVEERLARLDSEIHAIRLQAQQEAQEKEKQLRAVLEQEKQSILDSSVKEIAAASNKAQNQLKRLTAELAIERAQHKIAVTPDADRSLVESFLTDLDRQRKNGEVN